MTLWGCQVYLDMFQYVYVTSSIHVKRGKIPLILLGTSLFKCSKETKKKYPYICIIFIETKYQKKAKVSQKEIFFSICRNRAKS